MPKRATTAKRAEINLSGELLDFHDDLTALNTGVAFVLQAFATALQTGEPIDRRAASGAVFFVELLNQRTLMLEKMMADIRNRATVKGNNRRRSKKRQRSNRLS
jgi:hypothetical protein